MGHCGRDKFFTALDKIWETGQIPEDLQREMIGPIHKALT